MKLTRNEMYIAAAMGVKAPFLPVNGKEEKKLFSKLIGKSKTTTIDFDDMALVWWCKYVNGTSIFPKLSAYLRTYETAWLRNQAARSAMVAAKPAANILKQVMTKTKFVPVVPTVPPPVSPASSAAQTAPPAAPVAHWQSYRRMYR